MNVKNENIASPICYKSIRLGVAEHRCQHKYHERCLQQITTNYSIDEWKCVLCTTKLKGYNILEKNNNINRGPECSHCLQVIEDEFYLPILLNEKKLCNHIYHVDCINELFQYDKHYTLTK